MNTITISNQHDEIIKIYTQVTKWEIQGPYLVITKQNGTTVLTQPAPGHEVEIG